MPIFRLAVDLGNAFLQPVNALLQILPYRLGDCRIEL